MARETALKQSKNTRKRVPSRTTSTYTNTRAPHFTIKVELFVHLPNGTQRRCIAAIDSMSTHSYALADLTTAFENLPNQAKAKFNGIRDAFGQQDVRSAAGPTTFGPVSYVALCTGNILKCPWQASPQTGEK